MASAPAEMWKGEHHQEEGDAMNSSLMQEEYRNSALAKSTRHSEDRHLVLPCLRWARAT